MNKKWFFILFIAFFVFPALKFSGGWALFWLPFVLFWVFSSQGHCGPKQGEKPKRKRNYIETADGSYLEVIDEPKQV